MTQEFVNYNQALALKELGFDEPCFGWYSNQEGNLFRQGYCETYLGIENCAKVPLKQQVFKWFRKEYGYCSYLKEATKGTYRFYIDKFDEKFFNSDILKTYEEAESSCIDKLIEIIKNK